MANKTDGSKLNSEYVLGSLNDDSDDEGISGDEQSMLSTKSVDQGQTMNEIQQNSQHRQSDQAEEEHQSSIVSEVQDSKNNFIQIGNIRNEVEKIEKKIAASDTDKIEYEHLAEYLLQIIIKLDSIDVKNNERLRETRRSMILYVQNCVKEIDERVKRLDG